MSSQQTDLGAYLQQQASDGVKNSEGNFTVSHLNAHRKLGQFALPREHAWVSKLVQAAVGFRMKRLLITQSGSETQFFFEPEELGTLPAEKEIISTIFSGSVVADSPLEQLCVALRALVEQGRLSFLLVVDDGELTPQPVYAGDHYSRFSEAARLHSRFRRSSGMTLTVYHIPDPHSLTALAGTGLPIVAELDSYATTSPIPIVLDGRHVEGLLSKGVANGKMRPLWLSGLTDLAHSPPRLPLPPSFEEKTLSVMTHPRRARRSYGGRRHFAAALELWLELPYRLSDEKSTLKPRSYFHWVRDGVVVEAKRLDLETNGLALSIYANAEGLKSDLTGFQLVVDEAKVQRELEILEKLGQTCRELHQALPDFFRSDKDEHSEEDLAIDKDLAFRQRVKVLLKGSGAGLVLTLASPPVGVMATLGSFAAAFVPKAFEKAPDAILEHRSYLTALIKADLDILPRGFQRLARENQFSSKSSMLPNTVTSTPG